MKFKYLKPTISLFDTLIDNSIAVGSGYYDDDDPSPAIVDFIDDKRSIEGEINL